MADFKQLSRSVKGLTVLITGAASGMGRATARVFAAEGANVAVTDYVAEDAGKVAREIAVGGGSAEAWRLDVANPDDIAAVVGDVASHFEGLDIVEHGAPAFHPEYAYMGYSPIPSGKSGGVSIPKGSGAPSISVGE